MKSRLKFFVKMWIVSPLRALLLFFWGAQVNKAGWDKRLLIVNLEGMGDLVFFTSVLKHYKRRYPEKEVWLLLKGGFGVEQFFAGKLVDRIETINYRKFAANPFYGLSFINKLRRAGFETVINHDFCAAEILGKMLVLELGAKEVVGYEGMSIEWEKPFDVQQERNLKILREKLFPRFTKIIPAIKDLESGERLRSAIEHYITIYESVTGVKENEYATILPLRGEGDADLEKLLKKFNLERNNYVLFNVNTTTSYRSWPLFRFSKVAEFLETKGITVVVIGSSAADIAVAGEFQKVYFPKAVNLAGQTSLPDLANLVDGSLFTFANDTSLVHFAIALAKPSICIAGGGQFGCFANYGYSDINQWLWKKTACYFDDWHCHRGLPPGAAAPCVEAVPLGAALKKVASLVDYLEKNKSYPRVPFSPNFVGHMPPDRDGKKLKVVYAGTRNENYDPKRRLSFEYNNFYLTLANMPGVEVAEYQYDPVVPLGKERFNRELIGFIKSEKPDMFFAFMFSDELDPHVLREIKKYTRSVAWYADDSWRFYNYSRRWYPYFTENITTYSWIPALAAKLGLRNVVRSQWAANPGSSYPLEAKKDIDVSFVGQWNPERAEVVSQLRGLGIDVFVRGWGWPEGKASQEEMLRIIARSKITLNINSQRSPWNIESLGRLLARRSISRFVPDFRVIQNFESWRRIGIPQIKARPFELAACRAFVISGFADDLGKFYKENEEMVFYRSLRDLAAKIREYLPKEALRERIAAAGYARTMRDHTYEKRFRPLLAHIFSRDTRQFRLRQGR